MEYSRQLTQVLLTSLSWGHFTSRYTNMSNYGQDTLTKLLINLFDECTAEFVHLFPQGEDFTSYFRESNVHNLHHSKFTEDVNWNKGKWYYYHSKNVSGASDTAWKVSVFGVILVRISPYSVWMRENTDHNNSKYGHFLRSVMLKAYKGIWNNF